MSCLSGDNAVVIAMACLGLPPRQRLWGMVFGAGVAVVLRIVFTVIIAQLMLLPYLKIIGGLALFYIAAKLLVPEEEDESEVQAVEHLWRAVRIVAVADIVMSLDNVIAIAAAAQDNFALILIGLAISIPLIVAGAALIMALLERYPDFGVGRRRLAGLDCRRDDSDRPGDPGLLWSPSLARRASTTSCCFAAFLGAILVLVVGGMWRRSKQTNRAGKGRMSEVSAP